MKRMFKFCLCLLFVFAETAFSQEIGNIAAGRELAEDTRAECHSIESGDHYSPNLLALPFQIVADKPGMTSMALSTWFVTPHPTMPNFIISSEQQVDLIVYIQSMRSKQGIVTLTEIALIMAITVLAKPLKLQKVDD